jgi:hypothetical protein
MSPIRSVPLNITSRRGSNMAWTAPGSRHVQSPPCLPTMMFRSSLARRSVRSAMQLAPAASSTCVLSSGGHGTGTDCVGSGHAVSAKTFNQAARCLHHRAMLRLRGWRGRRSGGTGVAILIASIFRLSPLQTVRTVRTPVPRAFHPTFQSVRTAAEIGSLTL